MAQSSHYYVKMEQNKELEQQRLPYKGMTIEIDSVNRYSSDITRDMTYAITTLSLLPEGSFVVNC